MSIPTRDSNTMNDYMQFDADSLNQEVSIEINGTLQDIVSILSMISIFEQDGFETDDGFLSSLYAQIFEQIMTMERL